MHYAQDIPFEVGFSHPANFASFSHEALYFWVCHPFFLVLAAVTGTSLSGLLSELVSMVTVSHGVTVKVACNGKYNG